MFRPPPRHRPNGPFITPYHAEMGAVAMILGLPLSGTWQTANNAVFRPIYLTEPFTVAKAFWANGSTVGTDSIDLGVYRMTDLSTGQCDLIRSTGAVLSAGSANTVQETAAWRVAANLAALTTGVDSTDATSYVTDSVTLRKGRLYLLAIVNSAASADAVSSITGGGTWTSRASTQFNTAAHRVSLWSCVPTADYTGTITIDYGVNTQTSARWALNEFSGVDTTTNDGIVQTATGTGNDTTPLATLGAFGSANNATFSANANANTGDSTTTPGTGFRELSDLATASTPASFLQTQWRVDNDTTADAAITSFPWGAIAAEIKADASPFIIPPSSGDIYWAMAISGLTATVWRGTPTVNGYGRAIGTLTLASCFPLPPTCTPVAAASSGPAPMAGFSSRSLVG